MLDDETLGTAKPEWKTLRAPSNGINHRQPRARAPKRRKRYTICVSLPPGLVKLLDRVGFGEGGRSLTIARLIREKAEAIWGEREVAQIVGSTLVPPLNAITAQRKLVGEGLEAAHVAKFDATVVPLREEYARDAAARLAARLPPAPIIHVPGFDDDEEPSLPESPA